VPVTEYYSGGMWHFGVGRGQILKGFRWDTVKKKRLLQDLGVDVRAIVK
jgi:hypothetical protein